MNDARALARAFLVSCRKRMKGTEESTGMNTNGYELRESARARHMRIAVHEDGHVIITVPQRGVRGRFARMTADAFVISHQGWIEEMRTKIARRRTRFERAYGTPIALPKLRRGTRAYREAVASARALVTERARHFADAGGFRYGTISIRNQKTRWGSCSGKGNLSFNLYLAHVPPALLDYVVVHELAHTKHHDHSSALRTSAVLVTPGFAQFVINIFIFQLPGAAVLKVAVNLKLWRVYITYIGHMSIAAGITSGGLSFLRYRAFFGAGSIRLEYLGERPVDLLSDDQEADGRAHNRGDNDATYIRDARCRTHEPPPLNST